MEAYERLSQELSRTEIEVNILQEQSESSNENQFISYEIEEKINHLSLLRKRAQIMKKNLDKIEQARLENNVVANEYCNMLERRLQPPAPSLGLAQDLTALSLKLKYNVDITSKDDLRNLIKQASSSAASYASVQETLLSLKTDLTKEYTQLLKTQLT
eukprot:TRINITY_DN18789_c0_g1_i1.p1 TRINITY_DN18789_c0_g1~~TRINITY_DN18789_c0_g1_i1.p1  ORF type:complete len:158 (-),score=24.45 TRINITY_DN18789_c0_g1_i1:46-519(-)